MTFTQSMLPPLSWAHRMIFSSSSSSNAGTQMVVKRLDRAGESSLQGGAVMQLLDHGTSWYPQALQT